MADSPDGSQAGQPLSPWQMAGAAFTTYRTHFRPLFAVGLACALALVLIPLVAGQPLPPVLQPAARRDLMLMTSLMGYEGGLVTLGGGANLVMLAVIFVQWWLLILVVDQVLGASAAGAPVAGAPAVGRAFARLGPRLWAALAASVVYWVGLEIGFLLLVVPGVVVTGRWCLAPLLALLERRRAWDAVRRSRALVRGHFWHVCGTLLLAESISLGAAVLAGTLFVVLVQSAGIGGPLASAVWRAVVGALVTPFAVAMYVFLYRDLMAREGRAEA